jgi:L-amino acid N-acyltransferase YncA
MMPTNYRTADIKDLTGIVEIYNSTIPSRLVTAHLEPVSVESRVDWFRSHTPEKYPLWVIESEGKMLGWLGFQPFHPRPAYAPTAEISLYLAPSARGKGLGYQSLQFALEKAPEFGIQTLIGLIFAHNEPSIRLFEKAGFEEWGHLPRIAHMDGIRRGLKYFGKELI